MIINYRDVLYIDWRWFGFFDSLILFRNQSESLWPPEGSEKIFGCDKSFLQVDESPYDLSQIYDELRALERENWMTLSPGNTWQPNKGLRESWTTNTADLDSSGATQTCPGVNPEIDTVAPPIPPRSSSWNLSTTGADTELHIPESPVATLQKCHSPCILVDRKCNSPSVVRKFEAMLQENEGKVLKDGVLASCSAPANANCNVGCCHNRWSCDASKFTRSKLSSYGVVQKSFSEANILSAGKDLHADYSSGAGKLQMPPTVGDLPIDLLLSSLEMSPVSLNPQGSRRNIVLEKKTAEFNRTLFQAEMGRGADVQDVPCQQVLTTSEDILPPKESTFKPICAYGTTANPQVASSLPIPESTSQNTEVKARQIRCTAEVQDVRIESETSPVLTPEQSQPGLREDKIGPQSPSRHCQVKHKTPSSPSRKSLHRVASDALFSEPALSVNTQSAQPVDVCSSKKESPHGAKPQPAKAGMLHQQSSAESKQTQMPQPKQGSGPLYQSDSSRPAPRMMTDHPWKPLTLAAYPRPEGSRSNYGAVERILKNYESAARAQQSENQQSEMGSSPNVSCRQKENITELDMLDMDPLPLPPALRHMQMPHTSQASSHGAKGVTEVQLIVRVGTLSELICWCLDFNQEKNIYCADVNIQRLSQRIKYVNMFLFRLKYIVRSLLRLILQVELKYLARFLLFQSILKC